MRMERESWCCKACVPNEQGNDYDVEKKEIVRKEFRCWSYFVLKGKRYQLKLQRVKLLFF